MGFIYPLTLVPVKIASLNNDYQQANVQATQALLQDGGDYVAGIELIYNKTQPIAGIRHLMGPAIDYLHAPTPQLKEVMLASLYEDPDATVDTVINALKKSSVKFYVNNYRMNALPVKKKLSSLRICALGEVFISTNSRLKKAVRVLRLNSQATILSNQHQAIQVN